MRIVPLEGTRKVVFTVSFIGPDGKDATKEFESRGDLFSWVRGAKMFNISPKSLRRSVVQNVDVESGTGA